MARKSSLLLGVLLVAFSLISSAVAAREMAETSKEEQTKVVNMKDAGYGGAHVDAVQDCRYGCCEAVFGPSTPTGPCQNCCSPPKCQYGCCDAVFGPSTPTGPCQNCCSPPKCRYGCCDAVFGPSTPTGPCKNCCSAPPARG